MSAILTLLIQDQKYSFIQLWAFLRRLLESGELLLVSKIGRIRCTLSVNINYYPDMRHSEVRDALQVGHSNWKQNHTFWDTTIHTLLNSWNDPELTRIGMHLMDNFSSAKDPEDWIWEKMIYLHYYAVHYFQCAEEADIYVRNTDMSDFEKLARIVRLLIIQARTQKKMNSILATNGV